MEKQKQNTNYKQGLVDYLELSCSLYNSEAKQFIKYIKTHNPSNKFQKTAIDLLNAKVNKHYSVRQFIITLTPILINWLELYYPNKGCLTLLKAGRLEP